MNEETLFHLALEKAAGERAAFLEKACAGDAGLRQRLEVLIQAHDQPGSFLESPAPNLADTVDEPAAATERPGTIIGPYKLLEQIGEGGFGVVFMAEQQEPIRRKVALKVLKPGMHTREVIARFEAERQALALMDHANIAKVLDAGQTSSGRPYFVMDLVKGIPITEYCDQNQLTPKERLELFVHVCQAVQHAHQKGIIHRDLKPSNVLVTLHDGTPLVKIIDFGIAKALGQRLTDKTLYTGFAQMIGTPLYMSPEQAALSNVDVDTRSDIYSLGVLLYELLTGTTPFAKERFSEVGYDELRRIIREEELPKPSTRISTLGQAATTVSTQRKSDPKRLSQLLRGELDWIVMKCLEKDRNRRYETASGLAADVQHYLHDEPVQACPPSAWYRFRKFARRNKGPVAAACVVFLVLVCGIVTTTWGFLTARAAGDAEARQRTVAEEHFKIAKKAVDDYLTRVTEDPDLKRSDFNKLRKKLLESAVPFYQRFAEQEPGDAELEAERGRAYRRLGFLRSDMGERAEALADYEQMRTIFAKVAADFPTVPAYREELATSHNNLGELLAGLGQRDQAEAAYRAALAIQDKLAADFPTVPEYRQQLARSYNNLGELLAALGQRDQAEAAYRAALAIQEKLAADFPTVPEYAAELGNSYCNFGNLMRDSGRVQDALEWHRKAIQLLGEVLAKDNRLVTAREFLRNSYWGRARALDKLKRHAEAVKDWERAIELDEGPKRRQFRISRAVSLARAGDHVKAVSEANALAQGKDVDAADLYNVARVCSLASAAVKPAGSTGKAESEKLKEQYAVRALELLRQAVAQGFKDVAHIKKDTDLDALRQREDFKKLIAGLEANPKE